MPNARAFGDTALSAVSQILLENSRTEDVVCRYGGEDFALLLPGIEIEGALAFAERLRRIVSESTQLHSGQQVKLTCSFGVSMVGPSDGAEASPIQLADQALYDAKRGGRNRVIASRLQLCEAVSAG